MRRQHCLRLGGVGHFVATEPMSQMLPPWMPFPTAIVYATGVVELFAAAAVWVPSWRPAIGWLLIFLLLGFLPVNIYAAIHRVDFGGHAWGPAYLLLRVPVQLAMTMWVWRFAAYRSPSAPIRFAGSAVLSLSPEAIAEQILDVTRWREFQGYGPLPGIQAAEFITRTEEVVGSQVRVRNADGSTHVEEITAWAPERRLQLRLRDFSPPMSRLATHFVETWDFHSEAEGTRVVRSFEMFATNGVTRSVLWGISFLLEKAVARHLEQMAAESSREPLGSN